MKSSLLLLLPLFFVFTSYGSTEYYLGTPTTFIQKQAGHSKLPTGAITLPKGTAITLYSGVQPPKRSIQVSETASMVFDAEKQIELRDNENKSFINGELVTLPSGSKIQYFKSLGNESDWLLIYDSDQLLTSIIPLIKNTKTEQDAAANP